MLSKFQVICFILSCVVHLCSFCSMPRSPLGSSYNGFLLDIWFGCGNVCVCVYQMELLFYLLIYLFRDKERDRQRQKEREKHWFLFLYMPWAGTKLATVAHQDDSLTNELLSQGQMKLFHQRITEEGLINLFPSFKIFLIVCGRFFPVHYRVVRPWTSLTPPMWQPRMSPNITQCPPGGTILPVECEF